ncbi:MAG: pyridoxamine 5'-phosphate oxidase [Ferruginibacter sp.]
MSIADIRKDYKLKTFDEKDAVTDAIDQFSNWWDEATHSEIEEVNAMTLATATQAGTPDARIVLLKGFDKNGFVFFTNYESAKGNELKENPTACLVFFWKELERQIRIKGSVQKVSGAESDIYFASRPEGSRIGAWASPQSSVIENREVIEKNAADYQQQFNNKTIERPPHWGGYIVKPSAIEFWQGRPSRLHDRLLYTLQETGLWMVERLAP